MVWCPVFLGLFTETVFIFQFFIKGQAPTSFNILLVLQKRLENFIAHSLVPIWIDLIDYSITYQLTRLKYLLEIQTLVTRKTESVTNYSV